MFPASAGMNRCVRRFPKRPVYVPRERGDEPRKVTRELKFI